MWKQEHGCGHHQTCLPCGGCLDSYHGSEKHAKEDDVQVAVIII